MTGRRTFVAGEVLTASNINGFLMNQVVAIFADSGARAAAITSPTKGNVTYLQDVDRVERWNGSAWVPVSEPGLIATKTAVFTGTQSQSVTAGSNFAITNLDITHSVANAANHVLLFATVTGNYGRNGTVDSLFSAAIRADGNLLNIGDSAGSRARVAAYNVGPITSPNEGFTMSSVSLVARYTPGTTSAISYGVNYISSTTGTVTAFINRSFSDENTGTRARSGSSLVLMEVAA